MAISALLMLTAAAPLGAAPGLQLTDIFISGCLDGSVSLPKDAVKVDFTQLPVSLQKVYGKTDKAEIYRFALDAPSYFFNLRYGGDGGNADSICGVASSSLDIATSEVKLVHRVSGADVANPAPRGSDSKFYYWDPACKYQIMGTKISPTMRAIQIKFFTASQTADFVKRFPACGTT